MDIPEIGYYTGESDGSLERELIDRLSQGRARVLFQMKGRLIVFDSNANGKFDTNHILSINVDNGDSDWIDELIEALNASKYHDWRCGIIGVSVEIDVAGDGVPYAFLVNKPASYPDFSEYVDYLERRLTDAVASGPVPF